jgi:three-Cys-motif partner protein
MSTSSKDSFFADRKEWSARKIALIRDYLDSAARILNLRGQVYYLDGFAGRGYYGDSLQESNLGSPLVAAKLAQECIDKGFKYSLRCINIEEDPNHVVALRSALTPFQHLSTTYHGTFAQHADQALRLIGKNPAICFLDPFGVEGMDWDAVNKLIRKPGVTDLWLRFDTGSVFRLDGFYDSHAPEAQGKLNTLTRTYGLPIGIIHTCLNKPSLQSREERAVELYLQQLRSAFQQAKRTAFTAAYQIRSLQGENKYHLLFAAADKKAYVLASNIVYLKEEEHKRDKERYQKELHEVVGQMTMDFVIGDSDEEKRIFEITVQKLVKEMWPRFRGARISRQDLHTHLINAQDTRFGQFGRRHMTAALKRIQDGEQIGSIAEGTLGDEGVVITFAG